MSKPRTLWMVRVFDADACTIKPVGHKGRLLPSTPAHRVLARLRRAGIDAALAPVSVNLTPAQAAYLARRYA